MKKIVGLLMMMFIFQGIAQDKIKKVEIINVQTSALCGACKDRIEEKLNYTKGIIYSELDLETKKIEIKYKTKKISAEDIKTIISLIGYHADDVKRNKEAFDSLPECCRDENAACSKR